MRAERLPTTSTIRPGTSPRDGHKVEVDPHDSVDAEIDDDRRKKRRHVGRCDRMRERQPAIDRNEPAFTANPKNDSRKTAQRISSDSWAPRIAALSKSEAARRLRRSG